ncbi:MAG: PEP-utilizing enzyme [Patescibacteria group bacterium]
MNPTILEKIKSLHWINAWAGNWPHLDTLVLRGEAYEKEAVKICGLSLRLIEIILTQDGIVTFYRAAECYEAIDKDLLKKFEDDPGFIKNSATGYSKRVASDVRELQKIKKIKNLAKLSNSELAELFEKARRHFEYNGMIDIYDWYVEKLFTPVLEKILTERLTKMGKGNLVSEYISTLVIPHKISVIFKERQQLFAIIKYIRVHEPLLALIKSGAAYTEALGADTQFAKLFKAYFRKYQWMPVLVNNPPHTLETVFKEITDFVIPDAPLEIKTKRLGDNHDEVAIEKSHGYLKELRLSRREKLLVLGLRAMAFLRTEDYWVMSKSSFLVMPLYTEVAKRLGLTYSELKQFFPKEISKQLREGTKISADEVQSRFKLSAYVTLENDEQFFTGSNAGLIKAVVDEQLKTKKHSSQTSWKGVVGNGGSVRGLVRVALDPKEASLIKDGEILVVTATSAGFVPFLRKAGGIISEFGGLTSHQVIVAREFGVPCLVGVKEITKYLSTGDRVEIDAERGEVTLVKKI